MAHSFGVQSGNASDFTESTPLFGNVDDNVFIRRGAATVSDFQVNVAGLGIQWGLWTSSVVAPSVRQNETASETQTLDKFIMVSAAEAPSATIANMQGQVQFSTSNAFLANRSSGTSLVQGVSGSFMLDLEESEGNVTGGTLNLCIGASTCTATTSAWERWQTTFSGHLQLGSGAQFGRLNVDLEGSIVVSNGSSPAVMEGGNLFNVDAERLLRGSLNGYLTGTSAEGFVAGFRIFEEIAGEEVPSNSIIGTTAFRLPQAISSDEIADLTRRGFAVIGSGTSNSGINMGKTPDMVEGFNPLVYSSSPGFILRPAGSSHTDFSDDINYFDVQWGRWQGDEYPLHYQYHLSNGSIFNEISGDVIIASAVPSPSASLTGTHYFEAVNEFLGAGEVTIESVNGSFEIDFASGFLTNGKFRLISDNETWSVSTFTGLVEEGILSKTSMNGYIRYEGMSAEADDPFNGYIAGVFTGSTNLGFMAAFDLLSQDNQKNRYGAVLFEKVVLVPVLESAEYDYLEESGRFGFILGGEKPEDYEDDSNERLAVYGTAIVNASEGGDGGTTETFAAADEADVLAVDETPDLILKRTTAGVSNLDVDVGFSGVNWGTWQVDEGEYFKVFTSFADDRKYEDSYSRALFVNYTPTTTAELTALGNITRAYAGTSSTVVGKATDFLSTSSQTVYQIKSIFDVDLATGVLSNGLLSICMGNSTCDQTSEIWDISYSGNFHHGVLTSFDTVETTIDGETVSLVGKLLGGFAGTNAQHFIGGINMHVEDDSTRYVSVAYLLGQTSYLTGAELNGLNQDQFGMLATSGSSYAIYGGRSQQQGSSQNYLLADYSLAESGWHSAVAFHEDVPLNIFRRGTATQSVNSNVLNDSGSLVWGKWAGGSGAPIRRVSYISTETTLEQDAWWFIATPSAQASLSGKYAAYSSLINVQGGGSAGTLLKNQVSDFGFTVDLGNGTISNGVLTIDNGQVWDIRFSGIARGKIGGFGAFTSLTLDSASIGGTVTNSDVEGKMAGMLINTGNEVVTSFAFKNVHTGGGNEHIAGTLVTGKEDLTVDWGDWNTAFQSWNGAIVTDANALFPSFQLTPDFVIRNLDATYNYTFHSGSGYGKGLSAGPVSFQSVDLDAVFDLETADLITGEMTVTAGTVPQQWHIHFDGSIANGDVTLNPDLGTMTVNSIPVVNGSAALGGAFTGAAADGFVGAFDLLDTTSLNGVQGIFSLQQDSPD